MTKPEYFEDYVIGAQLVTSGRTITETDVVVHAGHTGDYFPHHVDAEFARSTPFGQRIAQINHQSIWDFRCDPHSRPWGAVAGAGTRVGAGAQLCFSGPE